MKIAPILFTTLLAAAFGTAHAIPSNVAPSGTATQSSDFPGFNDQAANAIDGNTNGVWDFSVVQQTITHTNQDSGLSVGNGYSWWQVALPQAYSIDTVTIWNRTDQPDIIIPRLNNFTVSVLNGSTVVATTVFNDPAGFNPTTSFNFNGAVGDIVRIQQNRQEYLHMAEVQVLATPVPEPASVALMLAGGALVGFTARRRQTAR